MPDSIVDVIAASPATGAVSGRLDVRVVHENGQRLEYLYQKQPLRALFPHDDDGMTAVIANTAGGVVGGDRHAVSIDCAQGTALSVTGQAAEKIYRSSGAVAEIGVQLSAGPQSWLEWLPQGTILFDRCRLRRTTAVQAHPEARVMAGEILLLGRTAMGERLTHGLVHDQWRVTIGDRLRWADGLRLAGDIEDRIGQRAGFNGAHALATFLYLGEDAERMLDRARDYISAGAQSDCMVCGVTCLPGLLLGRWLSRDAAALRHAFGEFWTAFRAAAGGRAARLPKIWMT